MLVQRARLDLAIRVSIILRIWNKAGTMNYYMQSTAEHSAGQNFGCRHYFRQLRDVVEVTKLFH
jgi:hypothetical protein